MERLACAIDDLVEAETLARVLRDAVQTPIDFLAVPLGDLDRGRVSGQAVPQLCDQFELLLRRKALDVDGCVHALSMPDSGALRYCTASGRLSSIPNTLALSCGRFWREPCACVDRD